MNKTELFQELVPNKATREALRKQNPRPEWNRYIQEIRSCKRLPQEAERIIALAREIQRSLPFSKETIEQTISLLVSHSHPEWMFDSERKTLTIWLRIHMQNASENVSSSKSEPTLTSSNTTPFSPEAISSKGSDQTSPILSLPPTPKPTPSEDSCLGSKEGSEANKIPAKSDEESVSIESSQTENTPPNTPPYLASLDFLRPGEKSKPSLWARHLFSFYSLKNRPYLEQDLEPQTDPLNRNLEENKESITPPPGSFLISKQEELLRKWMLEKNCSRAKAIEDRIHILEMEEKKRQEQKILNTTPPLGFLSNGINDCYILASLQWLANIIGPNHPYTLPSVQRAIDLYCERKQMQEKGASALVEIDTQAISRDLAFMIKQKEAQAFQRTCILDHFIGRTTEAKKAKASYIQYNERDQEDALLAIQLFLKKGTYTLIAMDGPASVEKKVASFPEDPSLDILLVRSLTNHQQPSRFSHKDRSYKLAGILLHTGQVTASGYGRSGHYVAYIRNQKGCFLCDGSRVTAISEQEFLNARTKGITELFYVNEQPRSTKEVKPIPSESDLKYTLLDILNKSGKSPASLTRLYEEYKSRQAKLRPWSKEEINTSIIRFFDKEVPSNTEQESDAAYEEEYEKDLEKQKLKQDPFPSSRPLLSLEDRQWIRQSTSLLMKETGAEEIITEFMNELQASPQETQKMLRNIGSLIFKRIQNYTVYQK